MKYLLRLSLAFAFVVIALAAGSLFLPARYAVVRTIAIEAPVERVFPLVADLHHWRTWNTWLTRDPAIKVDFSPATRGPGAWIRWHSAHQSDGRIELTQVVADERLDYRLTVASLPVQSAGSFRLVGTAGGRQTVVIWSSAGELGWSPLTRWFGLALGPLMGADLEKGLAGLKARSESPAQ